MEVRQLEYVVAIAETNSFTKAAERCHTAQSALSHQIARLEGQLGSKIFDRTSRSVALTEAGQVLLPYARRILNDVADAHCELMELDGTVIGRLRLGMTQTGVRALDLVSILGRYSREQPEIELSLMSGPTAELFSLITRGQLDLAITDVGVEGIPHGLQYLPLIETERLVAVVPNHNPLIRRKRVDIRELVATGKFVDFRENTGLRNRVDEICHAAGVTREVAFELGEIREMVKFAANGLGIAIVPKCFTQGPDCAYIEGLGARVITLHDPLAALSIGVFTESNRSLPAVRTFLKLLNGQADVAATL
ncbi:MAG: LysR family transcriptional regulator [Acidimicrobiales bacterium]